ncbi:MAG: ABC transporter permease [Paracoccaceae bacterium]
MIREMITRYGRSWGGYIWAILEPVGMIAILALVFSQFIRTPPIGQSFALFYATGFIPYHFFNDIASQTSNAVRLNRALMQFPVVTPLDAIFARFLLSAITLVVVAAIVFFGLILIVDQPVRLEWPNLIVAVSAAAFLGLGVGTTNALLFSFYPVWRNLWAIISRPLFIVSGVFYTFESLPQSVQQVLWWNPLIHVVGEARKAFYPVYEGTYISLGAVVGVSALAFVFSASMLIRYRSRVIESG